MAQLGAALRAVSDALIGNPQFGKQITLRTPGGAYDPETGKITGDDVDVDLRGLVEDYPAFQTMGGSRESGAGILAGDKKVTIAAAAVETEPVPTQQLIIGSAVYGLVKVDTIYAGDDAVLYVLQARR